MAVLAIISDIHGNLEALTAVLADIKARGIERIICLGDVVGYGPDPLPCLDLIRRSCQVTLCGNHDQAVLLEPNNFNVGAERACFWTRQCLEDEPDAKLRDDRWRFIGRLPVKHVDGKMLFVHGSPRRPVNEYIFPDDVYTNPTKISHIFERFEGVCFVGHTHVPGLFTPEPDFYSPEEFSHKIDIGGDDERRILNVGSVGQPRDRDPRACYVIVNETVVEYVRLEYDIQATVAKVAEVPALDNFLGQRLIDGR
ncbi:MAG: metallophosphoesterase family protein [Phycisphaerae bacterium]|nr:metallophosphoesterase family protein [Phycisphaerae bacterium]